MVQLDGPAESSSDDDDDNDDEDDDDDDKDDEDQEDHGEDEVCQERNVFILTCFSKEIYQSSVI